MSYNTKVKRRYCVYQNNLFLWHTDGQNFGFWWDWFLGGSNKIISKAKINNNKNVLTVPLNTKYIIVQKVL